MRFRRPRWRNCSRRRGSACRPTRRRSRAASIPDRDAQFRYLNDRAREHQDSGDPVISVDTKKKELVGKFKNGGREWQPRGEPERVNVHDFMDKDLGKAIPYGVYDVAADAGWVSRGHRPRHRRVRRGDHPNLVAHDRIRHLPAGAAAADLRRRRRLQRLPHPVMEDRARPTSPTRPGSPSPSATCRPEHPNGTRSSTGCSRHISMNWRGRPLDSHEVIVNTIAATTTRTGLTVTPNSTPAATPKASRSPTSRWAASNVPRASPRLPRRMELHLSPGPRPTINQRVIY